MKKSLKLLLVILFIGFISVISSSVKAEEATDNSTNQKIEELAKDGKPFTMVVNDNVILVEKFKLVSTEEAPVVESPEEFTMDSAMNLNFSYKFLREYYNNHYEKLHSLSLHLFISVIVVVIISILLKTISKIIKRKFSRLKTPHLLHLLFSNLSTPLIIIVGSLLVNLSFSNVQSLGIFYIFIAKLAVAVMSCSIIWIIFRTFNIISQHLKEHENHKNKNVKLILIDITNTVSKTVLGTILALFLLQNVFGLNINTLLTSAGIAGLAIAFAAQNSIANFLSSIMLIMDHPFNIGDRIVVDNVDGIVESIGFRSTKIRSLDGHLHYIPNNNMASFDIENIALRQSIKDVFSLTLTYDTTPEKMDQAMEILHDILDNHHLFSDELPPIINFDSFGDWALNIQVITWFYTEDYFEYLAEKSKINLEILKRFNASNLNFAFPTNTTYLAGRTQVALEKSE